MMKRLFSLGLMILLAITAWADVDFGNEATVSTATTWTFEDFNDDITTYTQVKGSGYLRAVARPNNDNDRQFSFVGTTGTVNFDGTIVSYTKVANASGKMVGQGSLTNTSTAGDGSNSNGIPAFAFNASVAGTVYVAMKSTSTDTNGQRIYFNNGTSATLAKQVTATGGIDIFSYTSTEPGSFFIGDVKGAYEIYAVRFVPTEITASEEKTWAFNDFSPTTFSSRSIVNLSNGLFARAKGRDMSISSQSDCTSWTFADGYTINSISNSLVLGALSNGTAGTYTPYEDTTWKDGSVAFKVTVPGKIYVVMANNSGNYRIQYYDGSSFTEKVNSTIASTPTEYSTDVPAGTVYIAATAQGAKIYAVRFVPATTIKVPTGLTGGTVTADKTSADENEDVTLTVNPDDGYKLKAGTLKAKYINASGVETELTITNNTFTKPAFYVYVTAEFELKATNDVTVPAQDSDGNQVAVDKATNVQEDETVTITITPGAGKQLSGTPTVTETNGSQTVTVNPTSDSNVFTFTMPTYAVTVSATFETTPATEITENPASFVGLSASDVTIIETSENYNYDDNNKEYKVTSSGGNVELLIKGVTFKYTSNGASFKLRGSDLLASSSNATITIPGLSQGQTVLISAKSKSTTSTFTISGTETSSSVDGTNGGVMKFVATSDGSMVLTNSGAGFALYSITIHNAYTVTATSVDDSKLTVNVEGTSVDTNKYEETTDVTVTATGTESYSFDHWSVAGNDNYSTDNPLTIENLSADIALTAHYHENATYTFSVTTNPNEGGTITAYKNDETDTWTITSPVVEGTKIKLVAAPASGYTFVNWKNGTNVVSTNATYTIDNLSANTALTATFISSSSVVPVILTAGQSNTDGRISDALPTDFTGLQHCYWSYCNAQSVPSGTFEGAYRKYTPGFSQYSPASDCGVNWAYDAVVYDLVGKALNSDFYVIKQAKGNTSISPDGGGCGVFWGADKICRRNGSEWSYDTSWFESNTSVNSEGLSLLKGFIENIDASMSTLETAGKLGDIKFMLWHQGECDGKSGNTAFAYYENLKAVVNYVRNYLATKYGEKYSNLPFICGTVAKNSGEYHAYVENALYRLQKDLENFYVINMSQGTFISDGVHFNQESATRLGKKMYNKIIENGYISGSQVEVEDVDAQIYNDNVYDFQNWANVNTTAVTTVGGDANTFKAVSIGSAVTGADNLYILNNPVKDEGMQADMPLNGRFAISSVTSTGNQNDDLNFRIAQLSNGNTGLHTKAGASVSFSILNLNPGDAVTIACSTDAIAFKSTNAYLSTDNTKAKVSKEAKWATGTKYIVTSGNRLDLTFGGSGQMFLYSVKINPGEVTETISDPEITAELNSETLQVTITAPVTEVGNTPAIYYTIDGTAPTKENGTLYTSAFNVASGTTVKAIATTNELTSNVVEKLAIIDLSDAVTYDFMAAYNGDNSPAITYGDAVANALHYYKQSDSSEKDANSNPVILADPFTPALNGRLSTNSVDFSWAEKGLSVKDNRVVAIHNLNVGDVIRIEYDGTLYYAKSNTKGGNALEGMNTGDIVKGLKDYTVSSVDDNNNYVILHTVGATVISQISINQELTQKIVPTPKITEKDASTFTYTISYMNGATLYYKKPGDAEYQTETSGTSIDVQATKLGKIEAYATMNSLTSGTASMTAYLPTKAIVEDDVYDFAKVKDMMSADYVLGTHGYGDAVTVGDFTLYKPDEVVATTLDKFAFAPKLNASGKNAGDWRLLAAGRLRAQKSAIADTLAVLSLTKGEYITFTYSGGASLKYMSQSTAKLADGTDVLTSKQAYEVLSDGILLLTVPADESYSCDITVISISNNETVSAPTLEERTEPNKVTLRLGTSSFGKTVTAYYTTDGSNPTTSSTAVTKSGAITVDETCTIKAYCVSETGVASGVTEYTVTLPAASKSASVVYDWLNVVQHGDELAFASDGLTVYDKEYDATDGWVTKQRKDFNAATNFDSKVSVRNGASGLSYDTDKKTIRLTKPMAIHNLGVGDEIVIIYTGDGTLRSAGADEGDAFTINGKTATPGMEIPSGATIKVTKTKYVNNYVVVTPSGPTSGKVYISAIYINHAAPTVANTPKAELASVDLDKMTSTYRITFDEGATLFYTLEADGSTVTGSNTGTYDLVISEGDKLKAWEVNGTLTSDTLKTTVYAPTPAPSTEGDFDFTEASEDLPADIEVTLDASKSVTVGGETLYKPSALTAATFGDKFAFTETGSSNKIRIRTNRQLVFSKGTNMSMGLLNLKKGDIISFDYTGTITFANPSQVAVESSPTMARAATRSEAGNDLTSGTAYIVQADGDVLLNLELTEASTNISKMYIAAAPTTSAAKALDFASAAEEYEELDMGSATSIWFNGKTSAQTFKRLENGSDELPIDGKISTESGSGAITIDGITAANRHIAIHNLAVGDQILVRFYGGALTFDGHETKGNRVRVDGKLLTAQDTLKSGDVIVIDKVDYLNNYVVLKLDSKCSISGIFINRDETEKVWAPTITESGKNTVLITAGRSSMEKEVTTYYTIDGTTPSELNGIGGPYPTFDVELLDGSLVEVKAISYSSTGQYSKVTTLVMFADTRTEIIGVPVEDNKESIIYDLSGRRVDTPRPGQIYIINGKKVLYRRK